MLGDDTSGVSAVTRILGYLKLVRPPNGFLMFLGVIAGYYVSGNSFPDLTTALLSFATAFGLNGASMVVNDIVDIEVDRRNAPWRPLPSGLVSRDGALALSASLSAIGLGAALILSLDSFAVALAFYAIALLYNVKLKPYGLLGNAAVSATVIAPFLYGSVIAIGTFSPEVLSLGLLAFLANMGREVSKGISDVEGDAVRGIRTVARVRGLKTAALISALFYLTAVALSPLPYFMGFLNERYLKVVVVADAGFVYSAFSLLRRPDPDRAYSVKKQSLVWMLIALLSFIVGA